MSIISDLILQVSQLLRLRVAWPVALMSISLVAPAVADTSPIELRDATDLVSSNAQIAAGVGRDTQQLAENFFTPEAQPDERWLSVGTFSQSAYSYQMYSRDTFEAARGFVFAGPQFRRALEGTVDWFAAHQLSSGYIPLWYAAQKPLIAYPLCPFQRQLAENGGVEQYDHVARFIDAALTIYRWNGDRKWLAAREPQLTAAWSWLTRATDKSDLIYARISPFCGADWADAVLRDGYATFVEVAYYQATRSLASIESVLVHPARANAYAARSALIADAINSKLWTVSVPVGFAGPAFGHYIGWIDNLGPHDYFETDSNAYAVAAGVAPIGRARAVMDSITQRWNYFVNSSGASRIAYGNYADTDQATDATHPVDTYTNGGYWMGVSMYLADALRRMQMREQLADLAFRVSATMMSTPNEGLYEWYHANGSPGLNHLQSWALGFPLLLIYGDIAGIDPVGSAVVAHPCIDASIGRLEIDLTYRSKRIRLRAGPGCNAPFGNGSSLDP